MEKFPGIFARAAEAPAQTWHRQATRHRSSALCHAADSAVQRPAAGRSPILAARRQWTHAFTKRILDRAAGIAAAPGSNEPTIGIGRLADFPEFAKNLQRRSMEVVSGFGGCQSTRPQPGSSPVNSRRSPHSIPCDGLPRYGPGPTLGPHAGRNRTGPGNPRFGPAAGQRRQPASAARTAAGRFDFPAGRCRPDRRRACARRPPQSAPRKTIVRGIRHPSLPVEPQNLSRDLQVRCPFGSRPAAAPAGRLIMQAAANIRMPDRRCRPRESAALD